MVFDFATYDLSGKRRFIVEAKLRPGASAGWAASTRRNWLSHGGIPEADGLALVVPDHIFFWPSSAAADSPPVHDIDARPLLAPYLERLGVSSMTIGPRAFEQIVRWWLEDLTQRRPMAWTDELRGSGLVDAIAGQEVVSEDAA